MRTGIKIQGGILCEEESEDFENKYERNQLIAKDWKGEKKS